MNKIKIFLILSGYQLTWLMCVFGEIIYNNSFLGLISGLLFISICFYADHNKKKVVSIVFFISIIGYLFDTILVLFKIYNFETSFSFGVLPIWMIVLWPSFAILFNEVFVFLSRYKFIAILLSSVLGPLTYYAGSPLGLININNIFLFLILMVIFWATLMFFYVNILVKLEFK